MARSEDCLQCPGERVFALTSRTESTMSWLALEIACSVLVSNLLPTLRTAPSAGLQV